jgi:DNA-binding beta-propeller fold protein YncE/cytochrome oxidase Cu insertion factor (SCO1/SenC/PrrC family)
LATKRQRSTLDRKYAYWAVGTAVLAASLSLWSRGGAEDAPEGDELKSPFPQKVKAPSFEGADGWLNSAGPIELSKLKGKIVLLDFWTYCCINCMHILPDLAKLEKEFANELVVVGVHSAKFDGERVLDNIRDAVLRYEIEHPVANDAEMRIWRRYGVQAWPTQVLIDPEGYYIGSVSGEGHYEAIRTALQKLIAYHEKKGTLDRTPLHFQQERYGVAKSPLRYPGKVAVDEEGRRLFIADSGHHRIVVVDLASGKPIATIGSGIAGLADGPFESARFFEPQGMAVSGATLYVADRKNHVVRKVDFEAGEVSTIAGTGKQGFDRWRTGPALEVELSSPWALHLRDGALYIAMAGLHQIWKLDLKNGQVGPYAGSGRENIFDGDLEHSALAQPSGLAADDAFLYFADSETSAVRKIGWEDGEVRTIVGRGLFEFGDVDGVGEKARLQHPLGVAVHDGLLYVADTYNNKIKTIDPASGEVRTFLGDGKPGLADDPPRFDEPSGLAAARGKLYVADTNNHAIRVVDLKSGRVSTMPLEGLSPGADGRESDDFPDAPPTPAARASIRSPGDLAVRIRLQLPKGQKLSPDAPTTYRIRKNLADGAAKLLAAGKAGEISPSIEVKLADVDLRDASSLDVALTWFPCDDDPDGVCRIRTDVWRVPLTVAETGAEAIELTSKGD